MKLAPSQQATSFHHFIYIPKEEIIMVNDSGIAKESGIIEEAKKSIMDNEHSIGEKAPGTPFAVVALSYLVVLGIACGAFAFLIWAVP